MILDYNDTYNSKKILLTQFLQIFLQKILLDFSSNFLHQFSQKFSHQTLNNFSHDPHSRMFYSEFSHTLDIGQFTLDIIRPMIILFSTFIIIIIIHSSLHNFFILADYNIIVSEHIRLDLRSSHSILLCTRMGFSTRCYMYISMYIILFRPILSVLGQNLYIVYNVIYLILYILGENCRIFCKTFVYSNLFVGYVVFCVRRHYFAENNFRRNNVSLQIFLFVDQYRRFVRRDWLEGCLCIFREVSLCFYGISGSWFPHDRRGSTEPPHRRIHIKTPRETPRVSHFEVFGIGLPRSRYMKKIRVVRIVIWVGSHGHTECSCGATDRVTLTFLTSKIYRLYHLRVRVHFKVFLLIVYPSMVSVLFLPVFDPGDYHICSDFPNHRIIYV